MAMDFKDKVRWERHGSLYYISDNGREYKLLAHGLPYVMLIEETQVIAGMEVILSTAEFFHRKDELLAFLSKNKLPVPEGIE
jgi:hypothetical protein